MLTKIIWREGLFLKPQHFQQQDHLLTETMDFNNSMFHSYPCGFLNYELDDSSLDEGSLTLNSAHGIFPNGQHFKLPSYNSDEISINNIKEGKVIYLRIKANRNRKVSIECDDLFDEHFRAEHIDHAVPDIELTTEMDDLLSCLPLCEVVQSRFSRFPRLNPHFIPPMLNIANHRYFYFYMRQLLAKCMKRINLIKTELKIAKNSISLMHCYHVLSSITAEAQACFSDEFCSAETWHRSLLKWVNEIVLMQRRSQHELIESAYRHFDFGESLYALSQKLIDQIDSIMNKKIKAVNFVKTDSSWLKAGIEESSEQAVYLVLQFKENAEGVFLQDVIETKSTAIQISPQNEMNRIVTQSLAGVPITIAKTHTLPVSYDAIVYEIKTDHALWQKAVYEKSVYLHFRDDIFQSVESASLYFVQSATSDMER